MSPPSFVLASRSRYRLRVLAEAGIDVQPDPSGVDERSFDARFDELGAAGFALELARRKADAVAPRHPDAVVLAADQVGVLATSTGPVQLTQTPDESSAVRQLMSMSGTTHELVNAVVVVDTRTGVRQEGIDLQRVTMRTFSDAEAREYVRRFEPFDSSGSYRLEDQPLMSPIPGFVVSVEGEHDSGVLGMPIPLLRRMLEALGADPPTAGTTSVDEGSIDR